MPIIIGDPFRATSTFSPELIPNQFIWWDFSDLSTLFQNQGRTTPITADGQTIQGVTDKSGSGQHIDGGGGVGTSTTYKENIKNGNSVMRSTRTGKNFSTRTQPFTIAIACESPDPGSFGFKPCVFSCYISSAPRVQFADWFNDGIQFRSDTTLDMSASVPNNTWGVFIFIIDSADSPRDTQVFYNGTLIAQGHSGGNNLQQLQLNSGFDSNDNNGGDIGEVMVYDRRITLTEKNDLNTYMQTKWGIP